MYFIVQGLKGGRPGCANPNLSSWWIEGNLKVFKRVASKCLTSMYAFTTIFPKSTVGGFFVFIDRYPCGVAFRRLVRAYARKVCGPYLVDTKAGNSILVV